MQALGALIEGTTVGNEMFEVTVVLLLAVHPLLFVTVTVYVPAVLTVLVAAVPPPLHAYVTPADPVAVNVTVVLLHVSAPSFVALTEALETLTVNGSEAVQFLLSVTVTVYVPLLAGRLLLFPVPKPPLHV